MNRPKERIELAIDELAAGGDGVGRDRDGRVTFVPRTVPGDRVLVQLREVRKDFARGEPVEILSPGPGRVEAPCEVFRKGRCGGCNWQHVSIEVQREAKTEQVRRALRKLVESGLSIEALRTPVPALGWRRRARLHWFRAPAAPRAEIGFYAPKSHFVADVKECVQLSDGLSRAYQAVRSKLGGSLHGRGQLHLLESPDGAHVVIDGAVKPGAARKLAEHPAISGVRFGKTLLGSEAIAVDGAMADAKDFTQASESGNTDLRRVLDTMTRDWRDGARILELFAGSGNLTEALAGARVVAVERSLRPKRAHGVEWREGDAETVVAKLLGEREQFDGVVLDPPRKGAREVMAHLAELGAARIVYVSCNPATLARDAEHLVAAGYRPGRAVPLDLMPQTYHVEVVMDFSKEV